ncbi:iron-containing redox enzyme family protein [Streptomyces sp. SL13]|uniref:Iron-containing redox enzyme family protein n=1 Tax=Streptantibioticus silvisoli TaxID=2705255 RepID=A0AA90H282_9ACTN|nr:iron-containing redox enzyme family protein [Streptantibioticus silvisoli]MDI5972039.1 iron-containing redox enzyme family protein [Streptantibioticus silvisoli]
MTVQRVPTAVPADGPAPAPAGRGTGPVLPEPRGDLSAQVIGVLKGGERVPVPPSTAAVDPYGDDLQLALYVLYELHYRGFEGVDDRHEWNADLLRVRTGLEDHFLAALREDVPRAGGGAGAVLDALLVEPVGHDPRSVSHYLAERGELWQLREYAALRSLYHLKEADPHVWVIPRLRGRAKAAMAAIEFDEFGAGRAEDVHAQLFADLLADLGLDPVYGRYLDAAPAQALATVNLMSLLGLHRALRGALVGHFASVEITSPPGSRRLAEAMRRAGAGTAAQRFYDEHVEADAVHEQVVRHEVVAGLLADEPALEADIVFGVEATGVVEDRLAEHLLTAWRNDGTALRRPLRDGSGGCGGGGSRG